MKTFKEFMSYIGEDFGSELRVYQQSSPVRLQNRRSEAESRAGQLPQRQKETTAEHTKRAQEAAAAASTAIQQKRAEYKERQRQEEERRQEATQEEVELQMEQIPPMTPSKDERFRQSRVHTRRRAFLSSSAEQKGSGYRAKQQLIGSILSKRT